MLIKNIEHGKEFDVKEAVSYEAGKVVSLTMAAEPGVGMTLFAFDEGEGVSTHAAPGDAFAFILEGEAQIKIADEVHIVTAGNGIVMPCGIPHSVKAKTRFKMLLTVVKQGK